MAIIIGTDGDDTLLGTSGDDTIFGKGGNDTLSGGDGNDILVGGDGNDVLDGGAGFDTVDYSQETQRNFYVNLSDSYIYPYRFGSVAPHHAEANGIDTLISIEHVITGAGSDYVQGSSATEVIETGAGNDTLVSGGGGDTLIGGPGDDTYWVSAGDTVIELAGNGIDEIRSAEPTFSLANVPNVENLTGLGATGQTLIGNALDNRIIGNSGSDTLSGGGGNDRLSGGSGADTLTGGSGYDVFADTAANLNGDTITDLGLAEKIVITDGFLPSFNFNLSGHTLSYTDGSLTLSALPPGHLYADSNADGLQITVEPRHNDFNGDGASDLLWRADDGTITDWLADGQGGFYGNAPTFLAHVGNSWQVVGTGDVNGDGQVDILWRSVDGTVTDWLGDGHGGYYGNASTFLANVPTSSKMVGTGDFDGDGHLDMLWQSSDGTLTDLLGQADGGFHDNASQGSYAVGTSWHVVGTGDFNGDGRDDILWQSDSGLVTDWLGSKGYRGTFGGNSSNFLRQMDSGWHAGPTGDFNGDGFTDVVWHGDGGGTEIWFGSANGSFSIQTGPSSAGLTPVAGGDFNGDGYDDIMWSNGSSLIEWQGSALGQFTTAFTTTIPNSWHVQDPFL